jgi:dolichol-phosphate mannosyltransferase
MKLNVVIPAYNEEGSISQTLEELLKILKIEIKDFEILVVNDNSKDSTLDILKEWSEKESCVRYITNHGPNGFGFAVRCGLENASGECVAIMMADLSDDPQDLVKYYRIMIEKEVDCVFGSRFIKGGKVYNYPRVKKILNRFFNNLIKVLFNIPYNDTTNAFKLYKKTTLEGLKPYLSPHFNLTVELPLKAMIRGYSYHVVPNSWRNRQAGVSKLKLKEMGSRYFFILLYCLIEKYFSRGDFKKK